MPYRHGDWKACAFHTVECQVMMAFRYSVLVNGILRYKSHTAQLILLLGTFMENNYGSGSSQLEDMRMKGMEVGINPGCLNLRQEGNELFGIGGTLSYRKKVSKILCLWSCYTSVTRKVG